MLKRNNDGNYEYEISLKDFFEAFKKFWLVIIATALIVSACVYAYFEITYKKTYTSSVQLIIYNSDMEGANGIADNYEYDKAEQLTTTYMDILTKSTGYLEKILEENENLRLYNYTVEDLHSRISVSLIGSSSNYFKISVKDQNPKMAVTIASEVVNAFMDDIVYAGNVRIIEENVDYTKLASDSSRAPSMGIISFVVSFAIMLFVVTFVCVKDTKIHSVEDVKSVFTYPVIGTIPCIDKIQAHKNGTVRREK